MPNDLAPFTVANSNNTEAKSTIGDGSEGRPETEGGEGLLGLLGAGTGVTYTPRRMFVSLCAYSNHLSSSQKSILALQSEPMQTYV